MKLRCIFVTDRRQVAVPDGWRIHHIVSVSPPRGKPQFQVLLTRDEQKERIGFRTKL